MLRLKLAAYHKYLEMKSPILVSSPINIQPYLFLSLKTPLNNILGPYKATYSKIVFIASSCTSTWNIVHTCICNIHM